jgi:hypothetical protein
VGTTMKTEKDKKISTLRILDIAANILANSVR